MKIFSALIFITIFFYLFIFSSPVYAVDSPDFTVARETTRGDILDVTVFLGQHYSSYYNVLINARDGTRSVTKGSLIIICDTPDNPSQPNCHSESDPDPSTTSMFTQLDKAPQWQDGNRIVTFTLNTAVAELPAGDYELVVQPDPTKRDFRSATAQLKLNNPPTGTVECNFRIVSMNDTDPTKGPYKVEATATGLSGNGQVTARLITDNTAGNQLGWESKKTIVDGSANFVFIQNSNGRIFPVNDGRYYFLVLDPSVSNPTNDNFLCKLENIGISGSSTPPPSPSLYNLCKNKLLPNGSPNPAFRIGDLACTKARGQVCTITGTSSTGSPTNEPGILTAIGCIPTNPQDFMNRFLRFAIAGAGGIALLLMIFGAIQMITSAGNPETLKKGQETFTAATIGLLFIIFSTLVLQLITVDVLSLPGFSP